MHFNFSAGVIKANCKALVQNWTTCFYALAPGHRAFKIAYV